MEDTCGIGPATCCSRRFAGTHRELDDTHATSRAECRSPENYTGLFRGPEIAPKVQTPSPQYACGEANRPNGTEAQTPLSQPGGRLCYEFQAGYPEI